MNSSDQQERSVRISTRCVCNSIKDIGLVMCWDCFKGRTGNVPFKDFDGSYQEWLKARKKP